jgi:hypothetical protein
MNTLLFLGSIAAVLALAAIAWMLRLGGGAIAGQAEARRLAEDEIVGFTADQAVVSTDRKAALVRGTDGSFVLLKVHGAQIASRHLASPLRATPSPEGVTIVTGERMFGDVPLLLSPEDRDKLLALV